MTWRVARSLNVLLAQWNAAHPGRSIASDGSIGDAAHQTRDSDHNPWVGPASDGLMIVTARDFTHDPEHGADADALAEALKRWKDPRVKYVIRNRRIWSLARDAEGWRPYPGDNPHTKHVHVSVSPIERLYDGTGTWNLTLPGSTGGTGQTPGKDESMALTPEDVQMLLNTVIRKDGLTVRGALAGADFASDQLADSGHLQQRVLELSSQVAELKTLVTGGTAQ